MTTVANLLVKVDTVTSGFTKGMKVVSLGLAAAAAASVKMALDYEDAFTKIDATTNASQAQIKQWKEQVLELSGRTAQAPQELADALFFLASAGLDASQIMPTLAMSAKASAVGLGDTADIARLTANALNAYAKEGLKAKDVTDILVAAVREGTAEPEEFANAMGRILPVASKAGISFDQIAGSLAGLSNIGLDVNEGVTAMRGVLQSLLAPGSQAADALKEIGLSADEVRTSLAQRGLIDTLNMLDEAAGGNIDTLRKIVPNVRALNGVFGLTEQEAAKVDQIFRATARSTGSLGKAMDDTQKGAGFKLQKALNRLRIVAIRVGSDLLPIVVKVVEAIGRWVRKFQDLDPSTRKMIIKIGLLVAVAGPFLGLIRRIGGGLFGLARGFGLSSKAAGAWGIALALTAVAAKKVADYTKMDDEQGKKWANTVTNGTDTLAEYRKAVGDVSDGHVNLIDHLDGTAKTMQALEHTVFEVNKAYGHNVATVLEGTTAYDKWNGALRNSGPMTINQKRNLAALLVTQERYGITMSDSAEATFEAFLKTGDYKSALKLLQRSLQDALGPLKNLLTYTQRQGEAAGDAAQKNRRYVYWLKQLGDAPPPPGGGGGFTPGGAGGQLAKGGRARTGMGYWVGERGMEWFEPDQNGTVVPNHELPVTAGDTNISLYLGDELLERVVVKGMKRAVARG